MNTEPSTRALVLLALAGELLDQACENLDEGDREFGIARLILHRRALTLALEELDR